MNFFIIVSPLTLLESEYLINIYSIFQRKANPFSYGTSEKDEFGSSEPTSGYS
jgi:hypothetical protein